MNQDGIAASEGAPTLTIQQAYARHFGPTVTAHASSMLEAYNLALSPGMQRNPARCSTPRQIAADILQCLAELTAVMPASRRLCDELREAYLLGKPRPPDPQDCGEWPTAAAVAQCAFDVRDALRSGDTAAAWRAAAAATYCYGAAESLLRPKWVRQKAKAAAEERMAGGREKGAEKNRAQRDTRRRRAIEIFRSRDWTKDEAAVEIEKQLGMAFATARQYLRGVVPLETSKR